MTVIRQLDASVTIFSVPFSRYGVPVGGRSTAVKMDQGKIVLFASHPRDPETARKLQELGSTVSHIVALDAVHQLYLSDYIQAYPSAKLVGPSSLVSRRKDLKFDIVLPGSPLDPELAKEFQAIPLAEHLNGDVIWYHSPTKTLIEADAMYNLAGKEPDQKAFSVVPRFMLRQMTPWTLFHRLLIKGFGIKNPSAYGRSVRIVDSLDFTRIIPCHGDLIHGPDAKRAWRSLYRNYVKADMKEK
ncbi:MAG: hypothetical protein CYPHOPRED_004363 [Cyphobasidiales sp. Tagirdzhanova-0007]|nr:MAG: hypothetical protein CYPHOPRED_004363 [Cyphobasidiales sp. Tagirdzhanova-0007]